MITKMLDYLKYLWLGNHTKGEPIGSGRTVTVIPGLMERPSYEEWKKEFAVGSKYNRFEGTGSFIDTELDSL